MVVKTYLRIIKRKSKFNLESNIMIMQKRQWGLISLLVTVLVVIVRTNLEMTANKTRDGINEGTNSQSGTINTEGKNTPEIIVDPDKLAELPKQEEKPKDVAQVKDDIEENGTPTANTIPNAFSLDIPFYAQAPDGDRELPRKEACEEASIALAAYYIQDRKPSKNQFKEDIIALTKLEEDLFGTYIDTTITQTAELYNKFYGIGTTKIIDNPTIDQIKTEIAQGHVIVAPFAGRELGNSYFTNG